MKFISENKLKAFFESKNFLIISCALAFLISIFLRSSSDIGADTGVYLDLGKKVSEGKKYYYDFFESNFPISFYFYALQFQISQFLHISPIILSEIVVNLLALASIFWSAKILKGSTINDHKAHYNLIIIGYFLGFFLRSNALQIGEFGTKTSLILIALFPYISFSFVRKNPFTNRELIERGILMGLIPCLKPHYLIFIIFIEFYKFSQKKSLKFFYEIDKLLMILIGVFYLFLMLKFTPEFFEFMVPMWSKSYSAYDDNAVFLENFLHHIAARIAPLSFIFLIFSRLKLDANDKILTLFFIAASLLITIENIGTIDQVVVFSAIATICFLKFLFDLIQSKKILLSENKFIITSLILFPVFDITIFPASIFGLGGFVNIWWFAALIYPFFLARKLNAENKKILRIRNIIIFLTLYFSSLYLAVQALKYEGGWAFISVNLTVLFFFLFFLEKKIHPKVSPKFSTFSVFVIVTSISCLLYSYITAVIDSVKHETSYSFPNKLSDMVVHYSKEYAPQKDDGILMISIWIAHQFPTLNYLQKENIQKFHIAAIQANKGAIGQSRMFPIDNSDKIFTYSYLFDDVVNSLTNPHVKVIFINNTPEVLDKKTRCLIGTLEYYFLDPHFKKKFLKNFHFANHVIINHKVEALKKPSFITREKPSIFDQVKPSNQQILHDFEVYIRNEKN